MKALKELIHLITRYKRRQIEILGYSEDSTSRYEVFYDRIEKGKLNTDEEAAAYLFGGKFDQYLNFKNSFKRRLVNSVFFIDLKQPEFNEAQMAYVNCWKNMAAVKLLQGRAAKHAATDLAKKTIGPAIKYELTEVVLEMARILKSYYGPFDGDRKKWDYYDQLAKDSAETLTAILKAESMYEELVIPYVKSRSSKPWIGEQAKKFLRELEPLAHKYPVYRLQLYYHLIARIERASVHDYKGTEEVCRRAIQFFEGKSSTPKIGVAVFCHTLVVCLTMTGKYEEAERVAQKASNLVEEGTTNWFKGKEQHLVLKFYQRDYTGAFDIFKKVTGHQSFPLLAGIEQESWKLYEGYIHLLAKAGKIQLQENEKSSSFRLAKFLNDVPEFSKDKRGMNVPVLIIHALFLLYLHRHDEGYDRILALEKYASRHLKEGDDTFRTWCFLQALLQIKKADFRRKEAQSGAEEWLRRMGAVPVMLSDEPHEVEAIPYEHLWEMAMEALERGGVEIESSIENLTDSLLSKPEFCSQLPS
ncbi:MAG: hypothetical protein EPO28_16865 [Saprospiraceae bacterium]|nr:MAG: hypothetical protein EPO28_16865 [Saprospiraceae bacterium]